MSSDDLDLDELKLLPEMVRDRAVGLPKSIKKRRQQFVQVPLAWVDILSRDSRDKTLVVLSHLLHLDWKQGGGQIKLPNGFLGMIGVGRGAKWRVLNKLESVGIISIERRGRKSPIIVVNHNAEATPVATSPEDGGRKVSVSRLDASPRM
jgi:hypothetical protein